MIGESFCRSEPAAALRGFGAGFLPSATSRSFSSRSPRAAGTPRRAPRAAAGRCRRRASGAGSPDRPQIRRHVLALEPSPRVAPRTNDAVLVDQVDGEAVDLRLDHVRDRLVRVEPLADVLRPLLERLVGRDLLERAHRRRGARPSGTGPRAAHRRAGRRVGRDELRVRLLERHELVVEPVVLGVGDHRVVEDVVRDRGRRSSSSRSSAARSSVALEDVKELLRRVDEHVRLLGVEALRPWMPPQVTATAKTPAAFARLMSNGESPTYAASSGSASRRSSASRSGSGSGLWRSVSSPPTTTSK